MNLVFKRSHHLIFALIWFMLLIEPIHSLVHYYSPVGVKKCFYKELTKGSLLVGKYKMEIRHPESEEFYAPRDQVKTGVVVDLEEKFNGNQRIVHRKGFASSQFTFSVLETGEHRICLTPRSFLKKKWYGKTKESAAAVEDSKFVEARISVDFVVTDGSSIDSRHTKKVERLTHQITRVNDKLIDIRREQQFIKEKEAQFRDQSERVCERVVRWSVVQLIALLVVGLYQLIKLPKIFTKVKVD